MKEVTGFFRLIRIPNLLIVALTQYMLRYCVMLPILNRYGVPAIMSDFHFHLLVLSTVLISAAGYIINDYFDVQIDIVNKPDKVVIDRLMHRHLAMALHIIFNVAGISLGYYIGWKTGNIQLGFVQLISAGLLWFYSTNYKRQFITGNLIVSLLSALVVAVVGFYERILYNGLSSDTLEASGKIIYILSAYAFFAFMTSLIREIVKDLEDTRGDADYNCRTIPLVLGIRKSKIIASALAIILMAIIGYVLYRQWLAQAIHPFLYVLLFIQFPLIYFLWLLRNAEEQKDFHQLSSLVKGIMLMGILSMGYFYYFSLRN